MKGSCVKKHQQQSAHKHADHRSFWAISSKNTTQSNLHFDSSKAHLQLPFRLLRVQRWGFAFFASLGFVKIEANFTQKAATRQKVAFSDSAILKCSHTLTREKG